jgi:hypothetical protein
MAGASVIPWPACLRLSAGVGQSWRPWLYSWLCGYTVLGIVDQRSVATRPPALFACHFLVGAHR